MIVEFLKPNKAKFRITVVIIVTIFSYSIMSSIASNLVNRSATTQFQDAAKVELDKDAKSLTEKLERQSFKGTSFSSIYVKALCAKLALSMVLMGFFAYLSSCIICHFIKIE